MPGLLALVAVLSFARPPVASADAGVTPWSNPVPIVTGLAQAARPSLVNTSDGVTHVVWESAGRLYYSSRSPSNSWTPPIAIAYGISPALALDSNGHVHALFANQFLGNHEIYHITLENGAWTLPVNASHTSGFSATPVVAAGPNGALYAAWADNSPGYWTIYVGSWSGGYWSNYPIPNGQGQSPSIAVARDGTIYIAWQDKAASGGTSAYTIYASEYNSAGWSLAYNISARSNVDSIGASAITTPDGLLHVTWVDDNREVRYTYGRGAYWPAPQTVAQAPTTARGPRIAVSQSGAKLHVAWDEGEVVRLATAPEMASSWVKAEVIPAQAGLLRDVALSPGRLGGVIVGWVQVLQPGNVSIYESRAEPPVAATVRLPLIKR